MSDPARRRSRRGGARRRGRGRLATEQIRPAFARSARAGPAARVSGTLDQAKLLAGPYGVVPEAVYRSAAAGQPV